MGTKQKVGSDKFDIDELRDAAIRLKNRAGGGRWAEQGYSIHHAVSQTRLADLRAHGLALQKDLKTFDKVISNICKYYGLDLAELELGGVLRNMPFNLAVGPETQFRY